MLTESGWVGKRNRQIHIRVTKEQHNIIHNAAKAKGYLTASAYLRDLALEKNLSIEMKIYENNKMLREILEKLPKPREIKSAHL